MVLVGAIGFDRALSRSGPAWHPRPYTDAELREENARRMAYGIWRFRMSPLPAGAKKPGPRQGFWLWLWLVLYAIFGLIVSILLANADDDTSAFSVSYHDASVVYAGWSLPFLLLLSLIHI